MKQQLSLFLKGMAMGMAEVVPGVSGGTIAFITGIYEKLLSSIKQILGPAAWTTWRQEGLAAAWKTINGSFLTLLLGGMVTGLIAGIIGITTLLEAYPPVVWAFFFGLIIASVLYIGRQINQWSITEIGALIIGLGVAYYLTVANPMQGNEQLLAVFASGAIAICALILPGISGSFILLLLGMYTFVLGSVRDLLSDPTVSGLIVVLVFALGCLSGLAGFSRLLSWTLDRFPYPTLAVLLGFMIGSLNKLWPWRNVVETRINSRGEAVPFIEANVLPLNYEGTPYVTAVMVAALFGFALVMLLERLGQEPATS